jgi:hypothetical protein
MRSILFLPFVLLIVAACSSLGLAQAPPDPRLAANAADVARMAKADPNPADAAANAAAVARAKEMDDAVAQTKSRQDALAARLDAIGNTITSVSSVAGGTPWGAVGTAIGGLVIGAGAFIKANRNSAVVNDHEERLAAVESPGPAAPSAPPPKT